MKNIEKMCIFKTVNIKFTSQESAYKFHYKHETQKQKARVFFIILKVYPCSFIYAFHEFDSENAKSN